MKRLLALALCAMLLLSGMALAEAGATDGEYTVTGPGFYGELNVTVTIEDGAISDIVVTDCPETPEIGGRAIDIMIVISCTGTLIFFSGESSISSPSVRAMGLVV